MANNYEVGYGKPPANNRWVPGCKSPNPAGRPRGSKNLYTLLNKIANEEIRVAQSNGKAIRLPKKAIALLKAVNAACSGDTKALKLLLPFLAAADAKAAEIEAKAQALDTNDEAIIAEFMKRNQKKENSDV